MKYVALLRGINVGGNNKVGMKQLKTAFEQVGMTDVGTYINSGNVIFESSLNSKSALASILEKAIKTEFGFKIPVLVYSQHDILSIEAALPSSWVNDDSMKCDIMFLWDSIDSPDILEQVVIKPGIDNVKYVPGALLWSVDRKVVTKSGLMKLAGTDTYRQMTIRNCNTLRKLAVLLV